MFTAPHLVSSTPFTSSKRWQLKRLLYANLLVIILLFTLFFPPTKALWRVLDTAFFNLINPSLDGPRWWQLFWGYANTKGADWFEDLCILGFFIAFVATGSRFVRAQRISQLVICTLYAAAVFLFFNHLLIRLNFHFYWPSPSVVYDHAIMLSEKVPWLHIKDSAKKSLPGDHATTALNFAFFFGYLARGRLAIFAGIYAALLCMPRLITGAHWLSDILVGTTCISIFFLSWLVFTPLMNTLASRVESFLLKIISLKRKWGTLKSTTRP